MFHDVDMNLTEKLQQFKVARYIKLGEKGSLAGSCVSASGEHAGKLYIGYFTDGPELYGRMNPKTNADWAHIQAQVEQDPDYAAQSAATHAVNQVRAVFDDDGLALWFTFHNRRLYWTFIDPNVPPARWGERGGTSRQTLGWRSTDMLGNGLDVWAITTRITQVQAYQRTVRTYGDESDEDGFNPVAYLRNLLLGETQPVRQRAMDARRDLEAALHPLIRLLTASEFENFVDMLFVGDGWQRVSEVGKQQDLVDGEYVHATMSLRMAVQVKSRTSWSAVQDARARFAETDYAWVYWAFHTADALLDADISTETGGGDTRAIVPWLPMDDARSRRFHLLGIRQLAALAIDKGLVGWLLEKAR